MCGFIGLDTLRRKAVLLYVNAQRLQQQRIFPSMNFSCSGTISKWTFVARSRTAGGRDQYPLLQLWRPDGTGRYKRVYESSNSGGVFTMADSGTSRFTVGDYIPNSPVHFEAGSIFGVYQASGGDSRLRVRYAVVPGGYGYRNHYTESDTSLEVFNTVESQNGNDYPLVAVNTGETQQTLLKSAYLCCS